MTAEPKELSKVQYEHALSELARLDGQLQKFGTIAALFLTAMFAFGDTKLRGAVYVVLAFLVPAAMQYVIANVYALFAMWICVYRYEARIFGRSTEPKPFFAQFISAFFLRKNILTRALAPPYLVGIMVAAGATALSVVAMIKGWRYVNEQTPSLHLLFGISAAAFLVLPYVSLLLSYFKLREIRRLVDNEPEEV